MHKKYIKVMENIGIDYIPNDEEICSKCIYFEVCPYTWKCPTKEKVEYFYENVDNDNSDLRDE